jgi:signal transduction histidine kinase
LIGINGPTFKGLKSTSLLYILIGLTAILLVSLGSCQKAPEKQSYQTHEGFGELLQLTDSLWHVDIPQALVYTDKIKENISQITLDSLRAVGYYHIGVSYYSLDQYDSSIFYYKSAMDLMLANKIPASEVFISYFLLLQKIGDFGAMRQIIDSLENRYPNKEEIPHHYKMIGLKYYIESANIPQASKYVSHFLPRHKWDSLGHLPNLDGYVLYSEYLMLKGAFEESLELSTRLEQIFKNRNDKIGRAQALLEIAQMELLDREFAKVKAALDTAAHLFLETGYSYGQAKTFVEYGNLAYYTNDFQTAVEQYHMALEQFKKNGNRLDAASILIDLAWVYTYQGLQSKSMEILNGLDLEIPNFNNPKISGYYHNTRGYYYNKLRQFDSASLHYEKASAYYQQIGYERGRVTTLFNYALAQQYLGNLNEALAVQLEVLELEKKTASRLSIAISENFIGSLYAELGQYAKAEELLNRAIGPIEERGMVEDIISNYRFRARLYEKTGRTALANQYWKKIIELRDEYFTESGQTKLAELETIFNLRQKDTEIEVLNLEKANRIIELDLKERTITNQRLVIIIVVGGLLAVGGLLMLIFRLMQITRTANKNLEKLNRHIQEQKEELLVQSEELQEANHRIVELNLQLEKKVKTRTKALEMAHHELDTFYYRASHDFKGPVSTLLGLYKIAQYQVKDMQALELFEKMKQTVGQLSKFSTNLNIIGYINTHKTVAKPVNFPILFELLHDRFKARAHEKEMTLVFKATDNFTLHSDSYLIEILLGCLLDNAINFTLVPGTKVKVSVYRNGERQLLLAVEDQGEGISMDSQGRIFDMFTRENIISTGNGLGLFIVSRIADKLDAKIRVKSNEGEGARFEIQFDI